MFTGLGTNDGSIQRALALLQSILTQNVDEGKQDPVLCSLLPVAARHLTAHLCGAHARGLWSVVSGVVMNLKFLIYIVH